MTAEVPSAAASKPGSRLRVRAACLVIFLALAACSGTPPSTLDARGPGARHVETLWWPMLWISTGVLIIVVAMLGVSIVRGRKSSDSLDRRMIGWGEPFVAVAGVFIPALILGGVYLFSLREMNALADIGAKAQLEVDVIGHDWWWEIRYPNGAVTANEIHIPVGVPVRLHLTSADVIHSFWVPQLQVKVDQIPGRDNYLWLQADEPGRYRGQCAEFCGLQHANMVFYVFADPASEFAAWVAEQALPATPTGAPGEGIFLSSSCAGCHAIRGTSASGDIAPDLTHLADRTTIVGMLANTPSNLTRFITDPHDIKPGVTMPPTELTAAEIEAVVAYLQSLD